MEANKDLDALKAELEDYKAKLAKAEKDFSDYKASEELKAYKNTITADIDEEFKALVVGNTKEEVDEMLEAYGVKLKRNKLYDAVYVANMCKADFLGKSVPTEEHLAKYVKDVIYDADADEGYVFNRFYADCMFMNNPIDWDDMV